MGGAIGIVATNSSKFLIEDLWKKVGIFEANPTMKALNYPPHLTFAIYPEIKMEELQNVARSIFNGQNELTLKFTELRCFENDPLVLYAHSSNVTKLTRLHTEIHRKIDPLHCDEYYRPDKWVAHCTLGTGILSEAREEALAFMSKSFEPIEVVFDAVDCIEYPPISITERIPLVAGLRVSD